MFEMQLKRLLKSDGLQNLINQRANMSKQFLKSSENYFELFSTDMNSMVQNTIFVILTNTT